MGAFLLLGHTRRRKRSIDTLRSRALMSSFATLFRCKVLRLAELWSDIRRVILPTLFQQIGYVPSLVQSTRQRTLTSLLRTSLSR